MSWVATAVAVASALAAAYNTQQTAKKADNVAAAGIRRNSAMQEEANQKLNKTIQDAKASSPDADKKSAGDRYLATVRNSLGQANSGLAAKGVSSQFDQLAGQEASQNKGFGDTLSGLMARMDAPVVQRQREGNSYGNLGMDFTRIGQNMAGDDFLTRLRAGAIRRNPYIDLASSIGNGYAANYGGSNGGVDQSFGAGTSYI